MLLLTGFEQVLRWDDAGTLWIAATAFLGLIVVLVVVGTRGGRSGDRSTPEPLRGLRFNGHGLRRAGAGYGLTATETRVLLHLVRVGHHRQAASLFRNRALLDGVLQRGSAELRCYPSAPPQRYATGLALLLSIKAKIEQRAAATIRSWSSLPAGTRIRVTPALGAGHESQVIASLHDEIACLVPRHEAGEEVHWRRGALVTVRKASEAGRTIPLVTSVLGYEWVGGRRALLLARAVAPATARQHGPQRRCLVTPVTVHAATDGRPRQRATVRTEQRSPGTVVSLLAGRAGIRSLTSLVTGSLVKVELELGRATRIPLYGKVVAVPQLPARGIMHVQLTGLSRSHLNEVYGFVDDYRGVPGRALGDARRRPH